jgi:hypothetical protein
MERKNQRLCRHPGRTPPALAAHPARRWLVLDMPRRMGEGSASGAPWVDGLVTGDLGRLEGTPGHPGQGLDQLPYVPAQGAPRARGSTLPSCVVSLCGTINRRCREGKDMANSTLNQAQCLVDQLTSHEQDCW